jgi:hypothetical protein
MIILQTARFAIVTINNRPFEGSRWYKERVLPGVISMVMRPRFRSTLTVLLPDLRRFLGAMFQTGLLDK